MQKRSKEKQRADANTRLQGTEHVREHISGGITNWNGAASCVGVGIGEPANDSSTLTHE